MIASRRQSLKHGPGRLVVDGRDQTVTRKAQFAFRPSRRQERELHTLLRVCREVYNAALQERRDAYRLAGETIRWQHQFNQIKHLKGVRDDALAYGIQPLRGAIMRCDEAMQAFFDRIKHGETPGFPRFKGAQRFNTACWDEPTSWKLRDDRRTLYIQGVGDIRLPKSAARQVGRMLGKGGRPVTLTVTRRRSGPRHLSRWVWRATVAFNDVAVEPTTPSEGEGSLVGADRGIKVTLATSSGEMLTMPRYVAAQREHLAELERAQARCVKFSREWKRLGRQIARGRRKAANQVDNWAREQAATLVGGFGILAVEDLELRNMTRSARGTVEEPGSKVAQKQGLNRELQDAALGKLTIRICVKAESAGRRVWMVNPSNTSRACSQCSHTDRANRPDQATFSCTACGYEANADLNAAANIADRGRTAETDWKVAGAPSLPRRKSRRRPRTDTELTQAA
ncbi:RNA-guided endonuclease InsQ/TnpB family protein [Nitriliruptor alkaliphilus]|uniref:RNA-guided endonuclease InsQ/TnpB family protein n=1 Tax=Nitriliruptor alkaliphilus TaxID=427918 RepID=UPI0012EEB520|nr:RNA-guided endonuclease TnpB family protein [Nitriliruptor alkaliphilus]